MALDREIIDRVAAAIESAEVGYSLTLTRLVDGERTYTLTYSDGSPPLTFDDIDDGYLHIRERKRKAQATAVIAALAIPEVDGGRFAERRCGMTTTLIQALSRLAENGQADGTSSLVSSEDRRIIIDGCYDLMMAARQNASTSFQVRVSNAHHALFHDDPTDVAERRARFFEEATETAQALGMTGDEAQQLVDYTFGRPAGDPAKEIGAAALTLASLCVVAGYDMMACAEADLEKLQRPETIARIRAKRATRHGRGPLPGLDPATGTGGER